MSNNIWLEIFSAPLKDQKNFKTYLTTVGFKNIRIDCNYWFFTSDNSIEIADIIILLQKGPWTKKMNLYPHFSRPLLSYYIKTCQLSHYMNIPNKLTDYIPHEIQWENNILDQIRAGSINPGIKKYISMEKFQTQIPKQLLDRFLINNYCLLEKNKITYLGNHNQEAVVQTISAHLQDLDNKIKRDKSKEYPRILGNNYQLILNRIVKHLNIDGSQASRILSDYLSDRQSETTMDYPDLGGIIVGKNEEMQYFWDWKVSNQTNINLALFTYHLNYLEEGILKNKLPTGRGDPWSIKKTLRFLIEINQKLKLPLNFFPIESHKHLEKLAKKMYPESNLKLSMIIKDSRPINIYNFKRIKKILKKHNDFHKKTSDYQDFHQLLNNIYNMETYNNQLEENLIDLLNKHRVDQNKDFRSILQVYVNKMEEWINE